MTIKDTEEKLYDPQSDIESRDHDKSVFDLGVAHNADDNFSEHKSWWDKVGLGWLDNEKRMAIYVSSVILGFIIFVLAIFFVVNKLKETAFSERNVNISIEGPEYTESSADVEYVIKYKNKNRVSLKNVELIINHSENFYPNETDKIKKITDRASKVEISDMGPFGSGKVEISGKFYAAENHLVYLQPVLKYEPSNFSSPFEATSQLGVRITSSPINLVVNAPKEALDESSIEYEIAYENKGTQNLTDLNLRLEYSEGFIFQSGNPQPVLGENVWHIGNLSIGSKGSIKVKGRVDGQQYDVKLLKAVIFKNENNNSEIVYGKAEGITKMVSTPLMVSHKLDGKNETNVDLGESLQYTINYSNRGDIGLKDVVIKFKIDSPVINYEDIRLKTGAYNSKTRDITWRASDIPELQKLNPGDTGEISFAIPLKEKIDITNPNDKNYILESVVSIDSSDVAFQSLGNSKNISNTVIGKLNSRVILESNLYYKDGDIENYGPIPQKLGEETTYVVNWKVTNVSNNISNVKVSAFLPTWISWKGTVFPEGEKITFNERTHEIIWDIGSLENGRGILNSPKEIKFQISLTPEINQVGKLVKLIYETKINGKDDFTGNDFNLMTGDGNISLEEFAGNALYGNLIVK